MQNIKVIVVPERRAYIKDTTYGNEIYINLKLGTPKLADHNARYVAPFWLDDSPQGVDRVYHIETTYYSDDCFILVLGNSFKLKARWSGMGNHRKFEYHDLIDFDLVEIKAGLLLSI